MDAQNILNVLLDEVVMDEIVDQEFGWLDHYFLPMDPWDYDDYDPDEYWSIRYGIDLTSC